MNDTGRSILDMLREGQLSTEDAERLMDAYIEARIGDAVATAFQSNTASGAFPWADDQVIRIAAFCGHRLLKAGTSNSEFSASLTGDVHDVLCYGSLSCGVVTGSASAGADLECEDVHGSVNAGANVECGDIGGNLTAGGVVECGDIGGSVMAGGNVECGDVGQNASAGGSMECGDVGRDVVAGGSVECGDVGGSSTGNAGDFRQSFSGFADFKSSPEWKTAREAWEKQARDFKELWKVQGRDMAENMRHAAQDMSGAAQKLARDIQQSLNDTFGSRGR